jgi:hypothetical protein
MNRTILIGFAATVCLVGCNKSSTSAAPSRPDDVVQAKLKELAGSGAKDCGRLDVKAANDQFKVSSTCATSAADSKKPFYVAYDMPGMTTGVAGNSEGKLFALELQGAGTGAKLESGPCPAALRVAPSLRLTCFIPGTMGLNPTGADPHSGIQTTPGASPHGGSMGIPQPFDSSNGGTVAPAPKKK